MSKKTPQEQKKPTRQELEAAAYRLVRSIEINQQQLRQVQQALENHEE